MKKLHHIAIIAFLLFLTVNATAQEQGDVVVHTDPRLSVLIKKKSMVMHASAAKAATHTANVTHPAKAPDHLIAEATHVTGSPAHIIAEVPNTPVGPARPVAETPRPAPNPKFRATAPLYIHEREGRVIYSGKGFRVQIYNGPDRGKAIMVKTEFMQHFPGIRTYLTYVSPCFRVKVGNYRHRVEALGMLKEANSTYSPCVIVPDIITINTY